MPDDPANAWPPSLSWVQPADEPCTPYGARPEPGESDGCAEHPNAPIPDGAAKGRAAHYQSIADRARRIPARHGQRPYRVFLVWRERGSDREWRTIDEVELQPARLTGLDGQTLMLPAGSSIPVGGVLLRDVSSAQVDEPTMRGLRRGAEWSGKDREFFYEVRLREWTTGEPARPRRFTPMGPPEYSAAHFGWTIRLQDQLDPRGLQDEGVAPSTSEGRRPGLRY